MPYAFQVEIKASLQDGWLISRILDFKEEIHREFLRSGHATIVDAPAVDRALDPLSIKAASKRALGNVSAAIERSLKRYDVADAVCFSRVS